MIKFLSELRRVDVHERPVGTNQTVYPGAGSLSVGAYSYMTQHNRPLETLHQFAGWTGPENVQTLCRIYLDRLATFIEEGQRLGYLTP